MENRSKLMILYLYQYLIQNLLFESNKMSGAVIISSENV